MGAGAHSDALPVDYGRDIVRMRALQLEGDHRSFAASRADQTQRIDFTQPSLCVGQKVVFMPGDALLSDRIDVVDRGAKADRLHDRRRARLEFVRRIAVGDPIPGNFADHLAAAIVGSHRHQMVVLGIEHAYTGRPI